MVITTGNLCRWLLPFSRVILAYRFWNNSDLLLRWLQWLKLSLHITRILFCSHSRNIDTYAICNDSPNLLLLLFCWPRNVASENLWDVSCSSLGFCRGFVVAVCCWYIFVSALWDYDSHNHMSNAIGKNSSPDKCNATPQSTGDYQTVSLITNCWLIKTSNSSKRYATGLAPDHLIRSQCGAT